MLPSSLTILPEEPLFGKSTPETLTRASVAALPSAYFARTVIPPLPRSRMLTGTVPPAGTMAYVLFMRVVDTSYAVIE